MQRHQATDCRVGVPPVSGRSGKVEKWKKWKSGEDEMTTRFVTIPALVLGVAVISLWSARVTGQGPSTPKAVVKVGRSYVPPRTPWGDPDLQGTLTNKYEQNTPLERPPEFEGRRAEDLTAAELADLFKRRQQQAVDRGPGVGPPQFRDNLEVAKGSRPWLIVDPPDGRIPPFTPEARKRIGPRDAFQDTGIQGIVNARERTGSSFGVGPFDGPRDLSLWDRCITRGLPGAMLPTILGNSYEIVQAPGLVSIRYELVHDARVIPLDGRPHVGKGINLELGDARGHWEGDSLVVETTNFKDRSTYRNANAATLRLVERFTRIAPDLIEWAVTVDDLTTWTRPWTIAVPLTMTDREPVLEYACHEGNYAMRHILSGARASERDEADRVKKP